ncbi:MAG TPA: NlpC/P60 family protein [Gemmatimonadota bacterium]|nr:NlpC/P60 family protein [Gemmatimonadota bacterium]
MPPNLVVGNRNQAVKAAQIGLRKALAPHGKNLRNGAYGSNTVKDVLAFRLAHGIRPFDGKRLGQDVWEALDPYLGPVARKLLAADEARRNAIKAAALTDERRGLIVGEAMWGVENAGMLTYRQYRPMATSLRSPEAEDRTDCSTYATLSYKPSGAPDPNGRGYDGYGYTGTLEQNGTPTNNPQPGDLVFYGTGAISSHVAIWIGDGLVASFGSEPGPRILPLRYRSDLHEIRTYPMVDGA